MTRAHMQATIGAVIILLAAPALPGAERGRRQPKVEPAARGEPAPVDAEAVEAAIERGVAYLRGRVEADPWWGAEPAVQGAPKARPGAAPGRPGGGAAGAARRAAGRGRYVMGHVAIELYALLVSDVSVDDPLIQKGFDFLGGLEPRNVYCTALYLMALDAAVGQLDVDEALKGKTTVKGAGGARVQALKGRLAELARWMVDARLPGKGAWNYTADHSRTNGRYDNSNTQFAVLALGVAAKRGVPIQDEVWEQIVKHFLGDQQDGGETWAEAIVWPPGRPESAGKTGVGADPIRARGWPYLGAERSSTLNMTAAGLSSLMIAREYLARSGGLKDAERARIDRAVRDGLAWVARNGLRYARSMYYGLYSIEKVGDLGSIERIGGTDWYAHGVGMILRDQRPDGSWGEPNQTQEKDYRYQTSFALLFLNRATDLLGRARPIFTQSQPGGAHGADRLYMPKLQGEISIGRLFRKLRYRPQADLLPLAESVLAEAEKQGRLPDLVAPALRMVDSDDSKLRKFAQKCLEKATGEKHKDPGPYRDWLEAWRKATRAGTEQDTRAASDLRALFGKTSGGPLKRQILWALERVRARDALPDLIAELEASRDRAWQERVHAAMRFISGTDLPFDPKGAASEKAEQIRRWRQWVEAGPTDSR